MANLQEILTAYEYGLDDGFYVGEQLSRLPGWPDDFLSAYRRGYDHGVRMYCDTIEDDEPTGPCLCGRGECPECGDK